MTKLPITCVIPCNNQLNTLRRAVDSALAICDEVIVVNDASDDTSGFFSALDGLLGIVQMYHTPAEFPIGVCGTRNQGITVASNGLIIPLDADDWIDPVGVHKLYENYESGHFVYGGWCEQFADGAIRDVMPAPIGMIDRKNVAYATILFDIESWTRAGGYDPDFNIGAEHWAFMVAMLDAGVKAKKVDEITFNYTIHPTGSRREFANKRMELIHALMKHKYPAVMK